MSYRDVYPTYRHLYNNCILYNKYEAQTTISFDAVNSYREDGPAEIFFDGYMRWSDKRIKEGLCSDAYISNDGSFCFCLKDTVIRYHRNGDCETLKY